jgi:hypothetical protein
MAWQPECNSAEAAVEQQWDSWVTLQLNASHQDAAASFKGSACLYDERVWENIRAVQEWQHECLGMIFYHSLVKEDFLNGPGIFSPNPPSMTWFMIAALGSLRVGAHFRKEDCPHRPLYNFCRVRGGPRRLSPLSPPHV